MAVATGAISGLARVLDGKIRDRTAVVGIVGLGYVGLPLAVSFAETGFTTVGFEVDPGRVQALRQPRSYIDDLPTSALESEVVKKHLTVTSEASRLAEPDAIIVCLPTPLGKARTPDLTILTDAFREIKASLRPGQLIILSSTTYPGTTEELARPMLEASGLQVGTDFFLAFSPERIDPANRQYQIRDIPRLVGGVTPTCAALARSLLEKVVASVHVVSTCRAAEMTKLFENTFRSVNIALVNEMAIICGRVDIDIWEVLDAAATKPFGFMRFDPGPGLGGHCIPIDPLYLSWKLRELNYRTRFVELAEDINRAMPEYVVNLVARALNDRGQSLRGARILGLGLAYKRNVSDARESPAADVLKQLIGRGATVRVHDPLVKQDHELLGLEIDNSDLPDELIRLQDCVLILTDHSVYDWPRIFLNARLVVDTRGVSRHIPCDARKVVRL